MIARLMIVLAVCSACGDAHQRPSQIEPISGQRIKLELYLYEDGSRQVDASSFYDTQLHTRCAPRRWADAEVRCVPIADEAVYTDAACSEVVGLAPTEQAREPTHFIGIDRTDAEPVPARLYGAVATTDPVSAYYIRQNDACVGPLQPPSEAVFYELGEELAATRMQVFDEAELGAGRLALRVLHTSDGLRVPVGVRDRALDLPCTPTSRADGAACEPTDAVSATRFLDDNCTTPAVVVAANAEVPTIARAVEPTGCTSYFALGAEVSTSLYRREAGACIRATMLPGQRAFALAAPIELAAIDRTVDDSRGRRLATVTLEDPSDLALRFTGDRLVDHAIRGECRPELVGDTVRCLPTTLHPATTLYSTGCAVAVPVVELPERTCDPVAFASALTDDGTGIVLHAIGDPMTAPLFRLAGPSCVPYAAELGRIVRGLGPALPAETFVSGRKYGER